MCNTVVTLVFPWFSWPHSPIQGIWTSNLTVTSWLKGRILCDGRTQTKGKLCFIWPTNLSRELFFLKKISISLGMTDTGMKHECNLYSARAGIPERDCALLCVEHFVCVWGAGFKLQGFDSCSNRIAASQQQNREGVCGSGYLSCGSMGNMTASKQLLQLDYSFNTETIKNTGNLVCPSLL